MRGSLDSCAPFGVTAAVLSGYRQTVSVAVLTVSRRPQPRAVPLTSEHLANADISKSRQQTVSSTDSSSKCCQGFEHSTNTTTMYRQLEGVRCDRVLCLFCGSSMVVLLYDAGVSCQVFFFF